MSGCTAWVELDIGAPTSEHQHLQPCTMCRTTSSVLVVLFLFSFIFPAYYIAPTQQARRPTSHVDPECRSVPSVTTLSAAHRTPFTTPPFASSAITSTAYLPGTIALFAVGVDALPMRLEVWAFRKLSRWHLIGIEKRTTRERTAKEEYDKVIRPGCQDRS